MKIELKNIQKEYRSRDKKKSNFLAVDDFSYTFSDGELTGLLGPSGCGKSTVLNMISGLLKPTNGRIFFGDEDVTDLPPEARGIGMVFQSYALYPHLTVEENIMFPLGNLKGKDKLTKAEMQKEAYRVAELVQIEELLKRKPKELSGGQMQRVAIARALVKKPKALLLDEPLSNLDARLRLKTREEIRRIQKETKLTTIFVTHDQEEAMSISDKIILMENGVINQVGKPQEVYDEPKNLFVAKFLGTPPINIFRGSIKDKKLLIGDMAFGDAEKSDASVLIGVRPEGFVIDENGPLNLALERVEVMGRDVSLVLKSPYSEGDFIKAIVPTEDVVIRDGNKVSFSLKDEKVFTFLKESGERI